jgi:hypothetical protein
MKETEKYAIYRGGCHCGAIRFETRINNYQAIECNCSICHKKGFLHLIVSPENFKLLKGKDFLTTYTFNTHTAKHTFCRVCGIHSFYIPRSDPNSIDVNLLCLDEDIIDRFEIKSFDGQNWEKNIHSIKSDD